MSVVKFNKTVNCHVQCQFQQNSVSRSEQKVTEVLFYVQASWISWSQVL